MQEERMTNMPARDLHLTDDQTEGILSALMNNSPIGMYIVQDGVFKYTNRQFSEILGYDIDELLGTPSLNYIYTEDKDIVRNNAVAALKKGYCKPYEFRIKTKSGGAQMGTGNGYFDKLSGKTGGPGQFHGCYRTQDCSRGDASGK